VLTLIPNFTRIRQAVSEIKAADATPDDMYSFLYTERYKKRHLLRTKKGSVKKYSSVKSHDIINTRKDGNGYSVLSSFLPTPHPPPTKETKE
jgi:hypothetical protein